MKLPHLQIGGKCRCCGFRDQGPRSIAQSDGTEESSLQESVAMETLYDDCPQARYYLSCLFIVMMPILFYIFGWQLAIIAAIIGGLFFAFGATAEDSKWYGLRNIQAEYEALLQSVQARKKIFYIKHLESALQPLFNQRDKAFRARAVLGDESFDEIEFKIDQIREKSQTIEDPALIEMYRSQLKDLTENRKKFEQLQYFLTKFEASRSCVAESIRLLRNRILITEASGDDEEESRILADLKSLHQIYERVNRAKGADLSVGSLFPEALNGYDGPEEVDPSPAGTRSESLGEPSASEKVPE